MEIKGTRLLQWLLSSGQRILILEGGARSGKSFSILQYLIIKCLQESNLTVRCYREDATTAAKTLVFDFLDIMINHFKIFEKSDWNATSKFYSFANGSKLFFDGTSDVSKLHGLRQDIAFLNEVMEISQSAYNQINVRTTRQILMDYNPSITKHWVFDAVLPQGDEKVGYMHSTYRDNPFLSKPQIAAIESYNPDVPENVKLKTANEYQWQVYGLGKRCGKEGRIFKDYRITSSWPDEYHFAKHGYGLDLGFSSDPTALIECGVINDELYLREIVYETGLLVAKHSTNPSIPSLLSRLEQHEIKKTERIVADCAAAESIATIQAAGWNVFGCKKGPDSILAGIEKMRRFNLVVHRGSLNIQEELENYSWDVNRATGQVSQKPIDKWNHACLVGDTMVETSSGPVRIRDVKAGDFVLTSVGYREVEVSRSTGWRRLYRITTPDTELVGSSDHPVFVNNNGKKTTKNLSCLTIGDIVFSIGWSSEMKHEPMEERRWRRLRRQFMRAKSIVGTLGRRIPQTPIIFSEGENTYIERCGEENLVTFRSDITFTIEMETMPITALRISFVSLLRSMLLRIFPKRGLKPNESTLPECLHCQGRGTALQREELGMPRTQGNPFSTGSQLLSSVSSVGKFFRMVRLLIRQSFVGVCASRDGEGSRELTISSSSVTTARANSKPTRIHQGSSVVTSVEDLGLIGEVFNLRVKDDHEYFANGILVSNCDAIRYAIGEICGIEYTQSREPRQLKVDNNFSW